VTPLSYSLPAFRQGGYARAHQWIDNLLELGFKWVTFTPTYLVHDEGQPRLDVSPGPDLTELFTAIEYARGRNMGVRLEPHLDWETTLTGGPYRWRADMDIIPDGSYLEQVLEPLISLAPDELTLGSELELATEAYPENWQNALARLRLSNAVLGHKLNHDFGRMRRAPVHYLSKLDYLSFSFYPPLRSLTEMGDKMRRLAESVSPLAGWRTGFAIGEFGLGSPDISRPWHFDAGAFTTSETFAIRQRYYLEFLDVLTRSLMYTIHPATFWTVGHFDFLGALGWPGMERFRDDTLRQAVYDYNTRQAQNG
jgi:hypothetical protein